MLATGWRGKTKTANLTAGGFVALNAKGILLYTSPSRANKPAGDIIITPGVVIIHFGLLAHHNIKNLLKFDI